MYNFTLVLWTRLTYDDHMKLLGLKHLGMYSWFSQLTIRLVIDYLSTWSRYKAFLVGNIITTLHSLEFSITDSSQVFSSSPFSLVLMLLYFSQPRKYLSITKLNA